MKQKHILKFVDSENVATMNEVVVGLEQQTKEEKLQLVVLVVLQSVVLV